MLCTCTLKCHSFVYLHYHRNNYDECYQDALAQLWREKVAGWTRELGCRRLKPLKLHYRDENSNLRPVQDIDERLKAMDISNNEDIEMGEPESADLLRYTPNNNSRRTPNNLRKFTGWMAADVVYDEHHTEKRVFSFDFEDLKFKAKLVVGTIDFKVLLGQSNHQRFQGDRPQNIRSRFHALTHKRVPLLIHDAIHSPDKIWQELMEEKRHALYSIYEIKFRSPLMRHIMNDFFDSAAKQEAKNIASKNKKHKSKKMKKLKGWWGDQQLARNKQYSEFLRKS